MRLCTRLGWGLVFGVLLGGCSLIVGKKLDEKGDAGPASDARVGEGPLADLDPNALAITGEDPPRAFFAIGERLAIRSANPKWKTAAAATLIEGDQRIPCPGAFDPVDSTLFRCTIPTFAPEGSVSLQVSDGANQRLGEATIEIRRLLGVGGTNQQAILLFTADPFERLKEDLPLPSVLKQDGATPLLSPSGRYLLLQLADGIYLIDLVNRKKAKIEQAGLPAEHGVSPHSFEPEFVALPRTTAPLIPIVFHLPETRLWFVTDTKDVARLDIPALFEGKTPQPNILAPLKGVRQMHWAVAPDPKDVGAAHKAGAALSATGPTHYLVRPDGDAVDKVDVPVAGEPLSITHALPVESVTALRRELYFVVLIKNSGTQGTLSGFNEAKTVLPALPLEHQVVTMRDLLPGALTTIPWTSMVGFSFNTYPNTGAATSSLLYAILGGLKGGTAALALKDEHVGALNLKDTEPLEELPTTYARWRFLVRSGSKLFLFPESDANLPGEYKNIALGGLQNAIHHPRKEQSFALIGGNQLRRINYAKQPAEEIVIDGLPPLGNGGVLIQP